MTLIVSNLNSYQKNICKLCAIWWSSCCVGTQILYLLARSLAHSLTHSPTYSLTHSHARTLKMFQYFLINLSINSEGSNIKTSLTAASKSCNIVFRQCISEKMQNNFVLWEMKVPRWYFDRLKTNRINKMYQRDYLHALEQSCPRVTFLGLTRPDPTWRNAEPTRPDPRLLTKSLTRPDPTPSPIDPLSPAHMYYVSWVQNSTNQVANMEQYTIVA